MAKRTKRLVDGTFPSIDIGPFRLSVQAGVGYACEPKVDLPYREDYQSFEVGIFVDRKEPLDIFTLGFPPLIECLFPDVLMGEPCIVGFMTPQTIDVISNALVIAAQNPNAGYPRGVYGWADRTVYHGTSKEFADDIMSEGIDIGRCTPGYFGQAFYVADDEALAKSNYADTADDEGAVLAVSIHRGARILDLRNAQDWTAWRASGLDRYMGRPGFHQLAVKAGVDGVYDRSMGGLAMFEPAFIEVKAIVNDTAPSVGLKF